MWPMNRLHESVVYFPPPSQSFIFQFYIYDELKLIVWIEYWNNYNCIFGERFMAFIVFRVPHSLTHNQLVGKLMEALWWLQKITWCQHFYFFFTLFLLGAGVEFSQINSLSFFLFRLFLKHHNFPFNFWFFSPTGEYKNYTIIKWFNSFLFSSHTHDKLYTNFWTFALGNKDKFHDKFMFFCVRWWSQSTLNSNIKNKCLTLNL